MAHAWDPDRYLAYADERGRPFVELLARVGADAPGAVVDLGCGPGNLTALLAERWPDAVVTGVDSSEPMIEKARASVPAIGFEVADLRDWARDTEPGSVDVLVSNATLQWVPGHLELFPELVRSLAPDGWFAFQVPGNFDEPSHTLRAELSAEEPYAAYAGDAARPSSHDPAVYLDALTAAGCEVDAWETTYLHVLTGEDPVFEWISGTSLRPTMAALPESLRPAYAAELKRRLAVAYPPREGRVVLPFRRIFCVARVLGA
ncbi:methyltransferase domain-containing protein [Nocardioides cheoyonin]|uniref:methyltransferase domain-containing protein n=1 Tax=Nocardioides cheoyonin TaxID=3156615 RepID=UPI0032B421FF